MLILIPLLPFAGFLINASFGRRFSKGVSGGIACAAMIGAFLVSVASSWRIITAGGHGTATANEVYNGIAAGDFSVGFTLALDPLSTVMILVVTGIGSLMHVYSTACTDEETRARH